MTTIREVLAQCGVDLLSTHGSTLERALITREDEMTDTLRVTAVTQFGLEPAFVAEVLTELGFGTPPSAEQRQAIHNNFHARMEELRRQFGQ